MSYNLYNFPVRELTGLDVAVTSATAVTVQPGTCRDSTNVQNIQTNAVLNVDITVSGAGGLDTGVEAPSTWYYVFVIEQPDGTDAGLLSASSTAPTLPPGYTVFRRLCAIYNDAGSNLVQGSTRGGTTRTFVRTASANTGASNISTGTLSAAAMWPPTAHILHGYLRIDNGSAGGVAAGGFAYWQVTLNSSPFNMVFGIQVDASSNVGIRQIGTGNTLLATPGGTRVFSITLTGGAGAGSWAAYSDGWTEAI